MLKEQKNSNKQGDVGVGIAIGWFAEKGYAVCIPLTDSQDYDLVVEMNNKLKKIQVKTTYAKNSTSNNYKVDLRTCGGNRSSAGKIKKFDKTKVDFIFAVTEKKTKYLIPSKDINSVNSIVLGDKWNSYIV